MHKSPMKTLGLIAAALTVVPFATQAADFPNQDIRIIVPWAPGGGVDTTSRIIAEHANKILEDQGVELVVENRTGGGGVVGQTYAANAEPDGYTVLAMTSSVVTNPKIKQVQYELSDFRPVALYNLDPELIVVPANSEFQTVEDFAAAAGEQALKTAVASPGTSHHISGLALENRTDLQFNFLHMDDFGNQVQAVVGGHVDVALWPLGESKKKLEAGSIRALAVSSRERLEDYPDMPTWAEAGFGINEFVTFRGWGVPAGTPDEAVQFLSDLLGEVTQDPAYREAMTAGGFQLAYRDASGFTKVIQNYDELTSEIIEAYGLATGD